MTIATDHLAEGQLYVVDTSVWARTGFSNDVRQALVQRGKSGIPAMAPPVALEVGYSARDAQAWDETQRALAGVLVLPMSARTHETARDLQGELWHGGLVRAVGCIDLLIALGHDAMVLHDDRDCEHLARVRPDFRQEWIVPPGSVA